MLKTAKAKGPVYCRDCRGFGTFERYPEGDIKTESGRVFLLKWRCSVCGHECITTNPTYSPDLTN